MSFVISFLIIFSLLGLALDFAFHRNYEKHVRRLLLIWANIYNKVKYIDIIHNDSTIALRLLESWFGQGFFSIRLVVISIISSGCIYFLINTAHVEYKKYDIDTLTFIVPFIALAISIDQLSLYFTKIILSRCSGRIKNILGYLFLDLVLVIILIGVPWTFSSLINDFVLNKITALEAINAIPYAYVSSTIYAITPFWLPFSIKSMTLHLSLMLAIFSSPFLPSIFHLTLIVIDMTSKSLSAFMYFLFESIQTLYEKERPIKIIFIGIGAIPILLDAIVRLVG